MAVIGVCGLKNDDLLLPLLGVGTCDRLSSVRSVNDGAGDVTDKVENSGLPSTGPGLSSGCNSFS